jgi:hypothetical protein
MEVDTTQKDKLLKTLMDMSTIPTHYKKVYKPKRKTKLQFTGGASK